MMGRTRCASRINRPHMSARRLVEPLRERKPDLGKVGASCRVAAFTLAALASHPVAGFLITDRGVKLEFSAYF